jgi:hypothetical protein
MKSGRVRRYAVGGIVTAMLLTGCSNGEDDRPSAPSTVSADVEQETPDVAATPEEPDPLAACSALFDGGADAIVQRAPALLAEVPQSLDSTTAQPYMVMDSELRAVSDLAPSDMRALIETVRTAFAEISAAVTSGKSQVTSDTSKTTDAITGLSEACIEAGFDLEEVEASPYGESVTSSRGNLVKEIGQLAGISGRDGDPVVDFRVTDIVVDLECTAEWAEAPANGHYVGLKFEVTTTPDLVDEVMPEFWISSHDFSVWDDDGKRVNDAVGNAYSCLDDADSVPDSIGPDESVDGWIVLDVPQTSGAIGYSWVGIDGGGGWEWSYGAGPLERHVMVDRATRRRGRSLLRRAERHVRHDEPRCATSTTPSAAAALRSGTASTRPTASLTPSPPRAR